ncbi:hypothetical protein, partial [Lentibacillus sediminis]|uniref:hypothetical protein n=1 Tax=Lentibacillus sediminis TaxID=1940529 RepID=UPI00195BB8F3
KLPPERENFRPREKTSARERKLPPERENFRPREKTSPQTQPLTPKGNFPVNKYYTKTESN